MYYDYQIAGGSVLYIIVSNFCGWLYLCCEYCSSFNLVLKKKIQFEGKIFSIKEGSINNSNCGTELIQVD